MTAQATPHPFSDPQWAQVRALIDTLDRRQALWLSGYLAARGESEAAPSPAPAASSGSKLLIAFGTETDNSRRLAHRLAELCEAAGSKTEVMDLARLRPRQLAKRERLVLITATHGDGDPPEPIMTFYEALMDPAAPSLKGLKFAVLALGDSSYERFCETGREFDQRLEALGAERLLQRQECDVDFEEPAAKWMQTLLELLPRESAGAPISVSDASPAPAPAVVAQGYSKKQPLTVEVLVNQNLSDQRRAHPIHHLELALDTPDFPVQPGDAVGILADNPPDLVAMVLDRTGLSGERPVTVDGEALALVEALRQHRDLTIPGSRFLETWAALSEAPALTAVLEADAKSQRSFLRQRQIHDLLSLFPARPEPQQLVDALRPLQPRLYDVANSLSALDDELHLTVKAFHYPFGEREEGGIASRYLLGLEPGDQVRLYPHRNSRFHLPEDPALPLLLIAEGTGLAPYRAFFQALAAEGRSTPCWLVFAEQHFEQDFLYQLDLQQARDQGVLQRVDTVFYQTQPGRRLADPLLAQPDIVDDWLARGAHLYLCGDKERLEQCETSLAEQLDARLGQGHWKQLAKDKRIHRNLY